MTDKQKDFEDAIEKFRNTNTDNSFDYSIDIDDKAIKRYKGLTSITLDLAFIKDSIGLLNEIKNNEQKTIERSIFISSIITYGRCFTKTRGRGTTLESKDYIKPQYKDLHEHLMELRHEYIAHAGISEGEKIIATAHLNILKETKQVDIRIGYEIFGQIGLSNDQQLLFLELIDDLTDTLKQKTNESVASYLSSMTTKDKNELLKKARSKKNGPIVE